MYPHPPNGVKPQKSRDITKQYQQFPGKGESLKKNQTDRNMATNSSGSNPRQPKSNYQDKNISKSSKFPLDVKKRDSFSRYTPLPSINDQKQKQKMSTNSRPPSKRTLQQYEMNASISKNGEREKIEDDILTATIKKMRLGSSSSEKNHKPQVSIQNTSSTVMDNVVNVCSTTTSITTNKLVNNDTTNYEQINLVIRLPKGTRVEHCFSSQDSLNVVLEFLEKQIKTPLNLKKYVLYTNEVPKREVRSRKSRLSVLGIKDRTVLVLDTRD